MKKEAGVLLIFLFCISFAFAGDFDCSSSGDITGYWKFDSDASAVVGVGGDLENGAEIVSNEKIAGGNSVYLDLAGDYVSVSDDGLSGSGDFSIGFWFRRGSFSDPSEKPILENSGDYKFYLENSGTDWILKAGVGTTTLDSGQTISIDTWYFVVLSYDSSNVNLYVVEKDAGGVDFSSPTSTSSLSGYSVADAGLEVGNGFIGYIDELVIFDRALSGAEIGDLYSIKDDEGSYCIVEAASGGSSTRSDFTIQGCELPNGESISVGSCSRNKEYYCEGVESLVYMIGDPKPACNVGADKSCCPEGYRCDDSGGSPICTSRAKDCSEYSEGGACKDDGCVWIGESDDNGKCYDPNDPSLSCSDYTSQSLCEGGNLGREGAGSDICGRYVEGDVEQGVIMPDSCKCEWDGTKEVGERCYLTYDVLKEYYSDPSDKDYFTCHKTFSISPCENGVQAISWTVERIDVDSSITGDDLFEDSGCVEGSTEKKCGQPVVRMPGFGFVNVVFVLAFLGVFYFVVGRRR